MSNALFVLDLNALIENALIKRRRKDNATKLLYTLMTNPIMPFLHILPQPFAMWFITINTLRVFDALASLLRAVHIEYVTM